MKFSSVLSTVAAFLLPLAAIAAPTEGASGLAKREACPDVFSMQVTIEDNSTYWLAPYRTRYTASGNRARIFPYDSYDSYILVNDTTLRVIHIDLPPDWPEEPFRHSYAFPLSSGNNALYFVRPEYFEVNPDRAQYDQDFVVTTIDPSTCEVTMTFGGEKQYLHFAAKGNGAPLVTMKTDDVVTEGYHVAKTIRAVPVNSRPN